MFVSKDGTVTGSVDVSQLDQIEPKTDEAKAQLDALKAEAQAGQEQAARDAERMAEQAETQAAQLREDDDETEARELEPEESAPSEPEPAPAEDLSALSKAELRDRVVAQRVQYGHDETQARADVEAENRTKAELATELGG
jgi:sRNA-binding protein